MGKGSAAWVPPNELGIAFGMMLEPLGEADRAFMMRAVPAPVLMLYPFLIERRWKKYATTAQRNLIRRRHTRASPATGRAPQTSAGRSGGEGEIRVELATGHTNTERACALSQQSRACRAQ